jgi:hypothetical protein
MLQRIIVTTRFLHSILLGSKKSTQWRIRCETRRESKIRVVKQEQCSELDLVEPPQDVPTVSPVKLEH